MVNKTVWEWLNLKSLWNSLIFLEEEHNRLFAGIIRLWDFILSTRNDDLADILHSEGGVTQNDLKISYESYENFLLHFIFRRHIILSPLDNKHYCYWVNLRKRGGNDTVFQSLAGLLQGIFRGRSPKEIQRSSSASSRKILSLFTLLIRFTFYF